MKHGRVCVECGSKLSSYNETDRCFRHRGTDIIISNKERIEMDSDLNVRREQLQQLIEKIDKSF